MSTKRARRARPSASARRSLASVLASAKAFDLSLGALELEPEARTGAAAIVNTSTGLGLSVRLL